MLRTLLALFVVWGAVADDVKRLYRFDKSSNRLKITAEYKGEETTADISKKSSDQSSSRNAGVPVMGKEKDRLDIEIETTSSGLKLHLKYFSQTADTKERYQFHQYIHDVAEYVCRKTCGANGNECCPYEATDMLYSSNTTYPLTDWLPAQYSTCADDGPCTVDFQTRDGNFKATFRLNTAGLTAGTINLGAADIKLDITEVYPLRGPAGTTALTIRAKVESMSKTISKPGTTSDSDQVADAPDTGLSSNFIWLNQIQCGNNNRPVRTAGLTDDAAENGGSAKSINWSIMKLKSDTNCVWDPVIQFVDTRFCAECWAVWFLVGSILVCCCCVIPLVWWCRKRRARGAKHDEMDKYMTEMG